MTPPRGKNEKPLLTAPSRARAELPVSTGPRLPAALARLAAPATALAKASNAHKFDKSFPVFLQSVRGIANGVGRNISRDGMFIETRDPCPIGSEVRVTFDSPGLETSLVAVGEVRYQCFLNYASPSGEQEGMRGIGVRFLRFEDDVRTNAKPTPQ
jgi:hypothetical protein